MNNNNFEEEIPNIYPSELTLKRTSESDTKLSNLDSICSSKYVTEVYDKRDAFNFNTVNFPYMSSNIPANPTVWCIHLTAKMNMQNMIHFKVLS